MKIVSAHLAAGKKYGQCQSPSHTVIAVRHQPIRGRIHRNDCYDRRRRPVCCCPHHSVLTVISPECTRASEVIPALAAEIQKPRLKSQHPPPCTGLGVEVGFMSDR